MIKPVWLFLDNEVQRQIGHVDYGLYTALFNIGYIFAILTDIGINQFVTKKLASEPSRLKEVFSNIFALKLIMLVVYPLFMAMACYLIGQVCISLGYPRFSYTEREIYFLAMLCFAQALIQLLFFFRANFQANQYFMVDSTASVMDKFMLILIVVIMLSQRITLDMLVFARIGALLITVLIFYTATVKLFDFIAPRLDPAQLKNLVKMSVPFAIITILYSINEKIDSIMIERLSFDKANAGLYAAAYRWLDAFMMYLWTILPMFFAKFAFHLYDSKEKQRLLNFGQIIASVPMTFVCVFIFFYGDKLFFQFKQSSAAELSIMTTALKILFLSAFVHGMFAVYSTLLTSTGYENKVSRMIIGSIVLNIIFNFILIPTYGAIGSAWVTLICSVFLSGCYLFYTHRYLDVKVPYDIILRLLIVFALFAGVFYLLSLTQLQWFLVTMLAGACLLLFSYLAGLLNLLSKE